MRYLVGFVLFPLALGTLRMVGCVEGSECATDQDCDDQSECTKDFCNTETGSCYYYDVEDYEICDDGDGDECTLGRCHEGVCTTKDTYSEWDHWAENETPCESDGIPGVCLCGVCEADPACLRAEECDDGNECTWDTCFQCGEGCSNSAKACDVYPSTCDFNGLPGVCIDGLCVEDPCVNADCDDGNACTSDYCDPCEGGCQNSPTNQCQQCERNGGFGVCVSGVCSEDLCEGVTCDDANLCTDDECDCSDGACDFTPIGCPYRVCNEATCDPGTGECHYSPADEGMVCGCSREECCIPFICISYCCAEYAHCQSGQCT